MRRVLMMLTLAAVPACSAAVNHAEPSKGPDAGLVAGILIIAAWAILIVGGRGR